MATYKLVNGKLVNIEDLPKEERKQKHFNTSIARGNGLIWNAPKQPQTRLVRDSKGDLKWTKKGSNNNKK